MSMGTRNDVERARREGVLLGIPLGDLGGFQSLLIGLAAGFAAFFGSTFVTIVALLIFRGAGRSPDFALSYRWVGLPVGAVVLVVALSFLGVQWSRRMIRRSRGA